MQFSRELLREQDFAEFYIQPECEATAAVICCGFALFVAVIMPETSSLTRLVTGR